MWGTMEELITDLTRSSPHIAARDIDILTHAFGQSRFIYLKREDHVAQAVSLLRAEQTDVWHITETTDTALETRKPQYDFHRIQALVKEAEDHNLAWLEWLKKNNIEPHMTRYEDLAVQPVLETTKVIDFLGLSLPLDIKLSVDNQRMSDELSKSWIKKFRSESH
jgi:LPS sulfotransferase NodH